MRTHHNASGWPQQTQLQVRRWGGCCCAHPLELVEVEGAHELRAPGGQGSGNCARAAMVHHGRAVRQQSLVRHIGCRQQHRVVVSVGSSECVTCFDKRLV